MKFLKKKSVYISLVILLLVGFSIFKFKSGDKKQILTVSRTNVTQVVAATGKIKALNSVDLGFDKSGRVESVTKQVGDKVLKGEVIATLESGDLLANLAKAKALLNEETVKLNALTGTSPVSFNDAYKNLDASIKKAYASADDAVRNKTDQFFKNIPDNPQFEIIITSGYYVNYFPVNSELALRLNAERKNVEKILIDWQKNLITSPENFSDLADLSIRNLRTVSGFLDDVALAVNSFISGEYAYESTVNSYKSTVASARSEVTDAISSIVTAKDKLNDGPSLTASGQYSDVSVQEAVVAQAQAEVSQSEAAISKSTIKAPFDGIITKEDAKVGAAVTSGTTLISITSENQNYIEANISEIHIGEVQVNNPVVITFDAFPDETFKGTVSYIEPGEVIVDGVVNYKIRVALESDDSRMKNGLTANLKIETSEKENVLALPQYALTKEDGQSYINKIIGGKAVKTPIETGIVGDSGFVEIKAGISEGEQIEY